jgi:TonB family protein
MKRSAIAFLIFLAFAYASYAQDAGQKASSASVHLGNFVNPAIPIRQGLPKYPQDAKDAHVMGTVALIAIVAKDGSMKDVQAISGPPMLLKSATKAVKQWKYEPTLLNGEPVEVKMTIYLVYSL